MKKNKYTSAFALFVCAAIALDAAAAEKGFLAKGRKFPLSNGVVVSLVRVEVQRISSDNTIDVAVVLDRTGPPETSPDKVTAELGEFCLRYQARIMAAAVPLAERSRINLFAPLFQAATSKSSLTKEVGFGFLIRHGRCSLEPPFPENLVRQTRWNAKLKVGR